MTGDVSVWALSIHRPSPRRLLELARLVREVTNVECSEI